MLTLNFKSQAGDFDLNVETALPQTGVCALFGPSGSGKTTLLRCIAGLHRASGRIAFGDEVWLDTRKRSNKAVHKRKVGFVFQDSRLLNHLSVAENLTYAQRRAKNSPQRVKRDELIEILELSTLLEMAPAKLSGGERQRVALARTLLCQPQLLLLDEPMSALDQRRRDRMLSFIRYLSDDRELPVIFVSHVIEEVTRLSDQLLALDQGHHQQLTPTAEAVAQLDVPLQQFGAVLPATVTAKEGQYQLMRLDCHGQRLVIPTLDSLRIGETVRLFVKARDVAIALEPPQRSSLRNILATTVVNVQPVAESPFAQVELALGDQRLFAQITRAAADDLALTSGQPVYALIKSVSFDR